MTYDNTNRGAIWPNRKKEKDTHPDFKGEINIEGKEYWVSAWKKQPGAHDKAPSLSISVTSKDDVHDKGVESAKGAIDNQPADDFDDQIPF